MRQVAWKGVPISRVSLGTVQLGLPYGIANRSGIPDREEASRIVREALRQGITHFDTAAAYGASEEILGGALAGVDVRVTTKLAAVPAGLATGDLDGWARGQVRDSLGRLHRERVDFMLVHEFGDLERHPGSLLEAMGRLKGEGRIARIGVSVYRPEEAERAMAMEGVEAVQFPFNALDGRWGRVLRVGGEKNVALFARSVFLQGFFWLSTEEVARRLPWALESRRLLDELSGEIGCPVPELGMRFALSHGEVVSVVVGCERAAQVEELARLSDLEPLTAAQLRKVEERTRRVPERVLDPSQWSL